MFNKKVKFFLKKKIEDHQKKKILYLRSIIHIIRYLIFHNYRKNRCLIDPPSDFFYKYKFLCNYFSFPLALIAKYFKSRNIFISVNNNCNFSPGHIYGEIFLLKGMQKLDKVYYNSIIWFTTSRKEILGSTKNIFEDKNFKILFGGFKRIFFTFAAMKDPSISIDGSLSFDNYIFGNKPLSRKADHFDKPLRRAKVYDKLKNYYPHNLKLKEFKNESINLLKNLNIKKKYIVIQIKTVSVNGTIKPLNPEVLLETIRYFQNKKYQIVFAGREHFPDAFKKESIIDYSNSKYASAFNDFILVGNCEMVISSGSGFCFIPESFDKPLLIYNAHCIAQHFGRRTIYVPTLLSRYSKKFNAKIQFEYLCKYGADCGFKIFDDFYILHMPTSNEIFMAARELESLKSKKIIGFSNLQKKIRKNKTCPLLSDGQSRISDYYLKNHEFFFR